MNLAQALTQAYSAGLERADAQLLMLHLLGLASHERAWLIAHDDTQLKPTLQLEWNNLVKKRLAGVPIAYLTGRKGFYNIELQIDSRVLDPRADTETLVDWALEKLPPDQTARVLDLGTGSGAIALAIAQQRPLAHITATDASSDALEVAQANSKSLNLSVNWLLGEWNEWFCLALQGQMFDLIISNPPYIAEGDPHLAALIHEPQTALVSGPDGLTDLSRIVRNASAHLLHGGWLLLEHGYDQAFAVRNMLTKANYTGVESHRDLAGIQRCSGGQWNHSDELLM
jgi:release factor glutamine methyltransferase